MNPLPTIPEPQPSVAVLDLSTVDIVIDLRPRSARLRRLRCEIPAGVIEMINLAPALRPERMTAARRLLNAGFSLTAEELADEILRQLASCSWR